MKRSLLAIAALIAAMTFSGTATAAPSPSQQIKALAKRVTALDKKVKTLETENRNLRSIAIAFCFRFASFIESMPKRISARLTGDR